MAQGSKGSSGAAWFFGFLAVAALLAYGPTSGGGAATATGRPATAQELLANDRLELDPRARGDLQAGRVTPELRQLLAELLTRHRLAVSVIATGHSKCVAGTNSVSHHWYGAAADVWKVDGRPVDASNQAALSIVQTLAGRGDARPRQIGHPFAIPENRLQGVFTDPAHRDHLHLSTWTGPTEHAADCG